MATTQKDPVLVTVQLSGGNDYLNTVIPFNDPLYRDNRPAVGIPDDQILKLDKNYGFHPTMAPLKKVWDQGKLAIVHGVGYANSPRSHFRSMDIWHTCEPEKVGTQGWLGQVAREYDPKKENVVTVVSFGQCLFRALVAPGVPVACLSGPLEKYGFLPNIQEREQRLQVLDRFAKMYAPVAGTGVMEYLGTTGLDSLKGADILKVAPQKYASTVKYPDTPIARKLRGIAQVHFADLGSRIFYCDHDHADNVIILLFSEFGRRVHDNGSGTDHGAAGPAFILGDKVKGGHFGEYPSLKAEKLVQGDLNPSTDFRSIYSTILEKWLKLDAKPITGGKFEQPAFLN